MSPAARPAAELIDARGRKYLTAEERARFLAAVRAHRQPKVQTLARTLALTGCRVSEALAIRACDVDLGAHEIQIASRRSGRPSQTAYPGAEDSFFAVAPLPPRTDTTPETFLPRLPNCRLCPEERRGSPRCLGHPLRACRGRPPRRVRPPLAHSRCSRCCLQDFQSPGHPEKYLLSRLHSPRPTRSRAYASPSPLPSPAQGSLPAGRAHPWPGGFRTRWMTNKGS